MPHTIESPEVVEFDCLKEIKDEEFTLNDGTVIKRAYASDHLEKARQTMLNWMGDKWLHHPSKRIQRKPCTDDVVVPVIRTTKETVLTTFADNMRSNRVNG